jgi:bifunctional DNA-binding transcriptional regulator/antitoxin component of YhaV-PrlF toxin-antitoxin module
MKARIVAVTRKGQATIPKEMREKHKVGERALAVEVDEGILLKPLPKPSQERGSLKGIFGNKSAHEILAEARFEDLRKDRELLERSLRH